MKILYFSRDYTPHDHRFLSALAKTEHKVYFLQLERRGHITEERSLPPEIELVTWAGGRGPVKFSDGPQLWADLRRVAAKIQPDVIQAGPVQRSAFLAALAGLHPLVAMSWGYDLLIDAKRNRWWDWATRYTLKHSDAFLGDCNTIRHLAVAYGMRPDRIVTFPWGIDLRHFSPQASQPANLSAFTLLSTRSWEPIYGVGVLAKAFVVAAQQCSELRLILLGNGSLARELRRIFAQGNVEERVTFPGHVGFADLPRYYRMADLYVSTSHSDGSSISLLEAMACGTPALVSDIPGNREWVDGTGVGWLFADGNVQALVDAILQAVSQRQRLPEMGRAARRLAEQRADWEKNFQEMEKLYAMVR
ncbi:MAG: glycosyltransferase family 4 protein [Chloroflexota bacterium]